MASDVTKQSRLDMPCLGCGANLLLPLEYAPEAGKVISQCCWEAVIAMRMHSPARLVDGQKNGGA